MRPDLFKFLPGVIAAALAVLVTCSAARAQVGTPTAFTPEISVVQSGVVNDVQATVSADEKYVTLTMRPQLSTLLSLKSFTFQQGNRLFGYVGMPETAGDNSAGAARVSSRQTPWVSARPRVPILQRQGMIQVSKPAPSDPNPGK
jgi:hypothetical protein